MDYLNNVISSNVKYNNSSTRTLQVYGDCEIVGLQVRKQPIVSMIDKALNVLSLGTWAKLKKENSFDKLFHLYMIVYVKLFDGSTKEILVEKNQSINISVKIPSVSKELQRLTIALPPNYKVTLNEMLNNTLKKVGNQRYFIYSPFNDALTSGNCQRFVLDVLSSNNLNGSSYEKWVLQNIESLVKGLPNYVKLFAKTLTDIGASVEKAVGGDEFEKEGFKLHAIIIKSSIPFEEAQKMAQDVIKDKKKTFYRMTMKSYRFRAIPKTKFKKGSFRTKKVNKDMSLIFGELK